MIESGLLKREEVKSRTNKTHQPCWLANLPNQQQKICDFVILTRIAFAPQSDQDRENDFLSRRTITRRQCGSASFHHSPLCGPLRTYRPIQRFPMVFSYLPYDDIHDSTSMPCIRMSWLWGKENGYKDSKPSPHDSVKTTSSSHL